MARHGLRAIIVVRAELIRDTCGYAVPLLAYEGDRDQHGKRFAREDGDSLGAYFENKDHVGVSIDGLPGLPLPCRRRPSATNRRCGNGHSTSLYAQTIRPT